MKKIKLKNLLKIRYGKGLPKKDRVEGDYPIYGSNGVVDYHNNYLIEGPALIIGRKGAIGMAHYSQIPCWPIDTTYYVEEHSNYSLKFLTLYFKTVNWDFHNKATAIPGLNRNDLYDVEIPYPPITEQHRIVAKIEALFSELDNGVANLEKIKAQLQTYRQSVLKHAFEGQLTAPWRQHYAVSANPEPTATKATKTANAYTKPAQGQLSLLPQFENQPASTHIEDLPAPELLEHIKAERQRQYEAELEAWEQQASEAKANGRKKPLKPRKPKEMEPLTEAEQQQLPALPEGWCWAKLGDILTERKEKVNPAKLTEERRYLALENIQKHEGKIIGIQSSNGVKSTKSVFYANDVLYGKLRPYLNKVVVPDFDGICSTDILVLQPPKGILSKFLKYRMLNDDFVNYAQANVNGVQHPRVSITVLNDFKVALPPLKQQKQIVREIESRLSAADSMESGIDQSLQQAESLRQSILKKAFEGTLVEDDEGAEAEKT